MKIFTVLWRWMTRADVRERATRDRQAAEAKLAQVEDHWRMVDEALGRSVDRGLIGKRDAP